MARSAPARKLGLPEVMTQLLTAGSASTRSISASSASISSTENTFIVRPAMSMVATRTPSAPRLVAMGSRDGISLIVQLTNFLKSGLRRSLNARTPSFDSSVW